MGLPVRIIILKFRQGGFTTICKALDFMLTLQVENRRSLACAHDDEASAEMFRMNQIFQDELPQKEKRQTNYSSKKEISFSAPHRSSTRVLTAGKENLGRAFTLHGLHCSEVAHWTNPKRTLLSALNALSDSSDTIGILESTAFGAGGEFYTRWSDAVRRRRERPDSLQGFQPLFFGWLDFDEYKTPVPKNYKFGSFDEFEQELKGLGATKEQLYWRRIILADKCGGDPYMFMQEFPATAEQAFQATGRPAIPATITNQHLKTANDNEGQYIVLRRELATAKVYYEKVADDYYGPKWLVWKFPREDCDYIVAGDVAEGALSDPADPRSEPDFSTGAVLNRRTLHFDAVLHGHMDPDIHGGELLKAAEFWNEAWVSPEVNSPGIASLLVIKNASYPKLYQRPGKQDRLVEKDVPSYGFKTHVGNRELMIDTWIAFNRPDPNTGFDEKIVVHSERVVWEEQNFVKKPTGKREHRTGAFDDLLFAHMICLMLHLACRRELKAERKKRKFLTRARAELLYLIAGGTDPGVGMEPRTRRTR